MHFDRRTSSRAKAHRSRLRRVAFAGVQLRRDRALGLRGDAVLAHFPNDGMLPVLADASQVVRPLPLFNMTANEMVLDTLLTACCDELQRIAADVCDDEAKAAGRRLRTQVAWEIARAIRKN